ncbi:NAD+ synthase [Planktothricoides raciborskii]|uniref:Glutamine-dependent NAD(+) synthetase n=2 Tax=Planktothricoides raciborskii TaxID=132608 RepID=A0AAU8JGB6_9CYAN|nr:NAD+ synthase [Planktothricoides raciborskii]MBD2544786.1 NAD+ synthase [Planktothricoides raciborskii FACHB-1370]MBD2582807.1 NAD+ synthase [Planktothricoides raciborskii FACHB-1261]
MKIAIAQLNPTIGDLSGNAKKILQAAEQAAKVGTRLLLTPELSLCGYPPRDLLLQPSFIQGMLKQLKNLANQLPASMGVLVGAAQENAQAETTGGKPLFNSIFWLENGEIKQVFHKRLLPSYDVFDEYRYFEPGNQVNVFKLNDKLDDRDLKIGVTICEDLWNDEEFWGKRQYPCNPIAELAQEKVDLMINLSASPYTVNKQKIREAMLRHAAQRYQTPIIYVNQVGGNDDLIFDGYSVAFNSSGEMVCRAGAFQADLITLELNESQKSLHLIQSSSQLNSVELAPKSEDEEIFAALVLGVKDYAQKCGFSQALLGLSGGIDSSLVAAIAAAALGSENVLGVLMPSPYSSDHSVKDALKLAENLGIKTHTLKIADLMADYDKSLGGLFAGLPSDVTEENLQSRIRGNLLMAIANKFGYLLLSTGNKSEMAVGYCTLYGDMNGGLAVIADVPKTRVYSICHWLNQCPEMIGNNMGKNTREIIPENVLTKAPSAELKPGQVDQDSLPAYDILDDILHRLVEKHESEAEIAAAGHNPETIARVVKLVTRAEFKRRQAPPGLKVTDRAFGTGWRMPIAARVVKG